MYVGNSIAFDHEIPAVPKYAPFIAAGFFFGPASFLHEVIKIPITSYLLCMYVCIYVCMFMLCTDDMQLLHRIYFYMTSVPNRYILSSLNTDDNNYANKTLSVCMYVCSCAAGSLRPVPAVDLHGRGDLHVGAALDGGLRHILPHCQRAQPLLRSQTLPQVLGNRE